MSGIKEGNDGCLSGLQFVEPESLKRDREAMVERSIAEPMGEVSDGRVLEAMRKVPRHSFVPAEAVEFAYRDYPLQIGGGQTISQPSLVAIMCEALGLSPTDRILEIGTGSGYHAAVLSQLVEEVYTIEVLPELLDRAGAVFRELGIENIHMRLGDGHHGWPEKGPYDAIVVTCAPNKLPSALVDQLKEGGRMVIPLADVFGQSLHLYEKVRGQMKGGALMPVRFVPMVVK